MQEHYELSEDSSCPFCRSNMYEIISEYLTERDELYIFMFSEKICTHDARCKVCSAKYSFKQGGDLK